MQYDKDMASQHAALFLQTIACLSDLIGEDMKVKYSEYITSYFSDVGGICYVKTNTKGVHIGWFRGAFINDHFDKLTGRGKTIRAHEIATLDTKEKEAMAYYVQESIFFLLGHEDRKKMKKHHH